MKKIFMIQWPSQENEYYTGKGFNIFDKHQPKIYDSEDNAIKDLSELTHIYTTTFLILVTAYIHVGS